MSADITSIRASVKSWERQFEAQQGRKPTSSDAKADKNVWKLYQEYKAHKRQIVAPKLTHIKKSPTKRISIKNSPIKKFKASATFGSPSKPRKASINRTPTKPKGEIINFDSDTEDDEDQTPSKLAVTEIFPTPQLRGRALGLFDLELPATPSRINRDNGSPSKTAVQRSPAKTPVKPEILETPMSKKTPDYFLHRVNLFPTDVGESPLIKHKRARKSVSDIVRESIFTDDAADDTSTTLSELIENTDATQPEVIEVPTSQLQSETTLEVEPTSNDQQQSINLFDETDHATDSDIIASSGGSKENTSKNSESDLDKEREYTYEGDTPDTGPALSVPEFEKRRKPKRQTKRVIMRPISNDQEISTSKATDNFVRLKINKKKPFKRR